MIASQKEGLSDSQENELIKTLNLFIEWLERRKIVESLSHIQHKVDWPFANGDWVMRVDSVNNTISFNTINVQKCSFEYYRLIVLHEFFHLAVQKVPNKEDAIRIKDDFGNQLMKLIDIEADFFTAAFCKEELGYDLVDFLKLYYEGSSIFKDEWIRVAKLERFIGSILSVSKMFINNPKKNDEILTWDLYLPSISPIYTQESLHILVLKKEHIYFDEIKANYNDFVSIKECYQEIDKYSLRKYVQKLVYFATSALDMKISNKIKNDISKLNNSKKNTLINDRPRNK